MAHAAFVIAGDHASMIANDVSDFRYRAKVRIVPVGTQIPVCTNFLAETQIMVEHGSLDVMVGGLVAPAAAGEYLRIAPGMPYVCRNIGMTPARLLIQCASPTRDTRQLYIRLDVAA